MKLGSFTRKTWIAGLLVVIATYQACTERHEFQSRAAADPVALESGNGVGYDGKPDGKYLAFDPSSPCVHSPEDERPEPNKIIEVRRGRPYKTQDECQSIPDAALGLSQLKISEHQVVSFAFEGLHFERIAATQPSGSPMYLEKVCRGRVRDSSTQMDYLLDVLVRSNHAWTRAEARTTAQLLFAQGSGGENSFALQSTEQVVVLAQKTPTQSAYRASGILLSVNETNATAQVEASVSGLALSGSLDCSPEKTGPNLLAYTQSFSRGPWQSPDTPSTAQIISRTALAPDSSSTAFLIADSTAASNERLLYHALDVAPQDVELRTFSIYLKKGSAVETDVTLQYRAGTTELNDSGLKIVWAADGSATTGRAGNDVVSSSLVNVGNGWYRAIVSVRNNGQGNTMTRVMVYPASLNPIGDTTGSVYVWGAQLEAGAAATSYQPVEIRY